MCLKEYLPTQFFFILQQMKIPSAQMKKTKLEKSVYVTNSETPHSKGREGENSF